MSIRTSFNISYTIKNILSVLFRLPYLITTSAVSRQFLRIIGLLSKSKLIIKMATVGLSQVDSTNNRSENQLSMIVQAH